MTRIVLPPCLFPRNQHQLHPRIGHYCVLGDDVRYGGFFGGKEIVGQFCEDKPFSPFTVYKVIWALVLRRFANTDDVYFGVSGYLGFLSKFSKPAREQLPKRHIHVTESDTFMDMFERVGSDPFNGYPMDNPGAVCGESNTEIHYVHGIENIGDSLRALNRFQENPEIDIQLYAAPQGYMFMIRADLMPTHRWQGVVDNFDAAIRFILSHPYSRVKDLNMFTNRDAAMIQRWNSKDPYSRVTHACIHDLIHIQASFQPDKLASDGWDGPMTFHQLWELSSRLSYYLYTRGVGHGMMVFFSLDLSKWAIIAMLAVLRTGAACIPIDLFDPTDYIQSLHAKLVIAAPSQVEQFDGQVDYILTDLPDFINALPPAPEEFYPEVSPQDTAFVVLTTGSGGAPKPAELQHVAVCTSVCHLAEVLHITDESRIFQCSSYNSNVSIADIFGTLGEGGCVCYTTDSGGEMELSLAINSTKATHVCLTPSILRQITPSDVPSLRYISVIGGGLTTEDVAKWQDQVSIFYLYGSTECTICCTVTDSQHHERLKYLGRINIGRPLSCLTWIVDPCNPNILVPVGAVGELVIEGAIIARGYISDAKETAKNFIHNPSFRKNFRVPQEPKNITMFRTGDLVKYEPDGSITFVGRMDRREQFDMQEQVNTLMGYSAAERDTMSG
ncbi:putative NRPS-like protein biosynthetic cluster [Emmonsiellopsis sp. PD_5]|nr:putative NRPS-like protein biosynthetic cluster [Emmonsiellopsis sp. PD_5]